MIRPFAEFLKLIIPFLFVSMLYGCASSQVYICESIRADDKNSTLHFKFLGPGGRVYVFDDASDMASNSILGFNTLNNSLLWSYLNPSCYKDNLLFGTPTDPDASYKRYDQLLLESRSRQMENNVLIRRARTIGYVDSGKTITWTRTAGKVRIGVTVRDVMYPKAASFLGVSDWFTAKAGKSYLVDYRFDILWGGQKDELEHGFAIKELK
jgi:hypothetical protein